MCEREEEEEGEDASDDCIAVDEAFACVREGDGSGGRADVDVVECLIHWWKRWTLVAGEERRMRERRRDEKGTTPDGLPLPLPLPLPCQMPMEPHEYGAPLCI